MPGPDPAARPDRSGSALTTAALVSVLVLCGFQLWWGLRIRDRLDEVGAAVVRLEAAGRPAGPGPAGGADRTADDAGVAGLTEQIETLRADFDFLAGDIERLGRKIDDLSRSLENRDALGGDDPVGPPELDWTEPELFEAARRAAESVGITLTADEVRVPARICIREGMLEYFACLKGGKEHETFLSLVGNVPEEARRPRDFGAKLNTAIQALGFKRGRPIRFSPAGTKPATGDPVHLFVEWTRGGATELVRAEDLVWNRIEERPMQRGRWVYVGSSYLEGDEAGTFDFAADLTAEAVATYSAPNTIIDNTEPGAQDDTVFVVATPRIPDDVVHATLVIRRTDREATKTFPAVEAAKGAPAGGGGVDGPR